mmetsp:Transcript_94689/g.158995  ORF Transcript_94689/g.158995 Transcript_94689/m.158995 type:complete len:204 (-) Transcript_94689:653-1264(-)
MCVCCCQFPPVILIGRPQSREIDEGVPRLIWGYGERVIHHGCQGHPTEMVKDDGLSSVQHTTVSSVERNMLPPVVQIPWGYIVSWVQENLVRITRVEAGDEISPLLVVEHAILYLLVTQLFRPPLKVVRQIGRMGVRHGNKAIVEYTSLQKNIICGGFAVFWRVQRLMRCDNKAAPVKHQCNLVQMRVENAVRVKIHHTPGTG